MLTYLNLFPSILFFLILKVVFFAEEHSFLKNNTYQKSYLISNFTKLSFYKLVHGLGRAFSMQERLGTIENGL
jgi:hypothetical protein